MAVATAAVWLVHPLQSEAVLYTTQRTELLMAVCYLGTLYAWIRGWDASGHRTRIAWRCAAVIVCLLGMGSKEVMISAPIMVVLYDRAFRLESWRSVVDRRDGRLWFYALLAATSVWLIALSAGSARNGTAGLGTGVHWYEYLYSQGWTIPHYLLLFVWPAGLTIDYGVRPTHGALAVPGLIVLAACAVGVLVAWRRADRWGWLAFLGSWFFLILAPSSSVIPITTEIAAERRVYLPLVAVVVLAAVGIDALIRQLTGSEQARGRNAQAGSSGIPAALTAAVLVIVLAACTYNRAETYRDPEALWSDAVAKVPENPRAIEALGVLMANEAPARLAEADQLFVHAMALDSSSVSPLYEHGLVALSQGRVADARASLARVVAVRPDYPHAAAVLGGVDVTLDDPTSAVPLLERAARADPSARALHDLGAAYLAVGRTDDALAAIQRAVAMDPSSPTELSYFGSLLAESGHAPEGVTVLERVLRMRPQNLGDGGRLAVALAAAGRAADARAMAIQVVEHSGDNPAVLPLAAHALMLAKDAPDAVRVLARADSLAPNTPDVLLALGDARATMGDKAAAEQAYHRVLAIQPGNRRATEALQKLTSR